MFLVICGVVQDSPADLSTNDEVEVLKFGGKKKMKSRKALLKGKLVVVEVNEEAGNDSKSKEGRGGCKPSKIAKPAKNTGKAVNEVSTKLDQSSSTHCIPDCTNALVHSCIQFQVECIVYPSYWFLFSRVYFTVTSIALTCSGF